ncbi:YdcF family protein [Marinitoga aeolica]|uniref:YdcF family protein n=1 Tax=Marinitoga aeolica TaxID=2809031 RepID=A0ABY8PQ83_9BACT|nr:YdcF family protein [Marinitoga aeolica]WGS64767.1 YdcF family protein [Marinitoga aeolica]
MLWIRKIIQSFFELPGLFVTLVILLNFRIKKSKKLRKMIIITSFIIYLFSIQITSRILVYPLEDAFSPINYNKIDKSIPSIIVVLGGGAIPKTPNSPVIGELSDQSFKRIFAGYELYKKTDFPIVISGGKPPNTNYVPEALIMRDYLVRFGVTPSNIFIEPDAQTTEENGKFVNSLIGSMKIDRIFLVTSAIHLSRSYKIFKNFINKDIEIIPVPSNYLITREKITWLDFKPDISALEANAMAIHEYLGMIYFYIFK